MPLACGTGLLPNIKRRKQVPKTLMRLNRIAELHHTKLSDAGARLGASLAGASLRLDSSIAGERLGAAGMRFTGLPYALSRAMPAEREIYTGR